MTTTPDSAPAPATSVKQSNEDRKREALMKKAKKAHDWRVQVWAQMEIRLRGINAQLGVLGEEPFAPYDTDFDDPAMLKHYSEMTLG